MTEDFSGRLPSEERAVARIRCGGMVKNERSEDLPVIKNEGTK